MPAPRRTIGTVLNKMIERVNSNIRRLRILEQESQVYKTRVTSVEEEFLVQKNQAAAATKELQNKLASIEEQIANNDRVIKQVISQMKKTVTTSKIKELEQLMDIYNPIKSKFVTREEVERIFEEKLREGKA